MYNILKVRDVYQVNYAKSYVLKMLAVDKLYTYSQSLSSVNIMHQWLRHNLDRMGLKLIINEKYEMNIIMCKKLEHHIKENL